jgi:ABC-type sugar transport system ATPase subunit
MRDGQLIDTRPASRWNKDSLVQSMLGEVRKLPAREARTSPSRERLKQHGLVLKRSALSNLMLADLRATANGPFLSGHKRLAAATGLAKQLDFDAARLNAMAFNLSGGNQQKLVLGKWLFCQPRVLLLDEPTRGIDLKAKREIFQTIRRLSDQGMSVILVSSDLEEVVEYSDSILSWRAADRLASSRVIKSVRRLRRLLAAGVDPREGAQRQGFDQSTGDSRQCARAWSMCSRL